ncbi:hypothetical protein [Devosia ginsengisoli]|uniref:hypothetical protein n=1 Tax=Devosia ginsengisoli TaxID=400770 RepID=UPI0026EF66F7|nr:hypothetical protein [Devosia ginsengisoli]MCR6672170.1 hypothetical protein [Devosia ginsengisoli]
MNSADRRAKTDALRDMLRSGESTRALLLSRVGVDPKGLLHLQQTSKLTAQERPA